MRIFLIIVLSMMIYLNACQAYASTLVSVISNKYSKSGDELSKLRIRSIFMMSSRYWDNGVPIRLVLMEHDRIIHRLFISSILNMSPDRYESIINAKISSGLSKPPIKVMSELEMLDTINSIPGSIGYVGSGFIMYKDEYGNVTFVNITETDYE